MNYMQYKLLRGKWKNLFDFYCLHKDENSYLSPFKLDYNERLLKVFLDDQKSKRFRGKDKYEDLARGLLKESERSRFIRNKEGISYESMKASIVDSMPVVGVHYQQMEDGYRYPALFIKLSIGSAYLNKDEIDFIDTALPSNVDIDLANITVHIAHIPIHKRKPINEEVIHRWAVKKAIRQFDIYYAKVHDNTPPKLSLKTKVLDLLDDLKMKYFQ